MHVPKKSRKARLLASALALCLVAGPSLAVERAPQLPYPGNPNMSRAQQKQLGLKAAGEVYKQMPVLPDSNPLTKYVQNLGKRLETAIPPEYSWPYQFHVVEQKEINAFALPGGPIFINVGTIRAADNEAELAGVMSHEMAHVYMQHSAKQQQKNSLLGGIAGIAGAIAGALGGTWGTLARSGIQFGAGTLSLKYSRADEAQADAVGAIIMWKAGYNPVALADFFDKIAAEGNSGPQFLSDHPNPGNRRQAIENEIRNWPRKRYLKDSAEFAVMHKKAEAVPAYTAQQIAEGAKSGRWAESNKSNDATLSGAGSREGKSSASVPRAPFDDVRPSASFRTAYLGALRIDRPENWLVMQGAKSGEETIAPTRGVAGSAVAYGVVIQSIQTSNSISDTRQLTASIAQSLENSDGNMKQIGAIQTISVDGISAGSVELETVSPMFGADGVPRSERDWLVAVPRGSGQAVFLVFVSPEEHFAELKRTFDIMLRSVRF